MKAVAFAFLVLLLVRPAFSEGLKRDVQGVEPGLTVAQVESTIGAKCAPFGNDAAICGETENQTIVIFLTKAIHPPVVKQVRFQFCSAEAQQDVFQKVMQAYSIDRLKLRINPATGLPWERVRYELDDHTTFSYPLVGGRLCSSATRAYEFEITNNQLVAADNAAAEASARKSAPTPKF
jgi:hypothetical protein